MGGWILDLLRIPYRPRLEERPFLERADVQRDDDIVVRVAVLDDRESERFFGVPLARRGIQPLWLSITNHDTQPCRLRLASLDPNYYPPLEAAFVNHFAIGKRLLGFGLLAWFFFPMLILLPFKILGAGSANRRMNAFFQEHGIGSGLILPGKELAGFVFTSHDAGIETRLGPFAGRGRARRTSRSRFRFPVSRSIFGARELTFLVKEWRWSSATRQNSANDSWPSAAKHDQSARQTAEGDPLNLVVIGDFDTILTGFGARWDETETINLGSCWRMLKAFLLGTGTAILPSVRCISPDACQDFALQKARQTINERLHLRLWVTPLRFKGKPVWIGQISRDIGVRFTLKTWNLTTHKIDPNVDEARDYVLDDLMEAGRVSHVAYVPGVAVSERTAPRHNLTGDPYFTDGLRAVAIFSETRTTPTLLNWA